MSSAKTSGIFISYRRQDTAWPARQIYEVISRGFRADRIFKDVDNIEPGEDFVEKIQDAVFFCDVLLVLIGPNWVNARDEHGRRRLDDPRDFVRLEVRAALERDITVIPILVDETSMPRPDDLPPDLAPLTRRQAIAISPVSIDSKRLLKTIKAARERRPVWTSPPSEPNGTGHRPESPGGAGTSSGRRSGRPLIIGAAVLAAVVVLVVIFLRWLLGPEHLPVAADLPDSQMVVAVTRDGNTDLWVVGSDGGAPIRRLTWTDMTDTSPNLSPDRRSIIYRRHPVGDQSLSVLRVVAVDGSGDRPLFSTIPGECRQGIFRPSWNPDKPDQLAVFCDTATGQAAYLVRTDGKMIRQLHLPGRVFGDLTFSPNGKRIAFWSAARTGNPANVVNGGAIHVLDLDTDQIHPVTNVGDSVDADVSWSPSGDLLAFRRRFPDHGSGNFDLMTIVVDGGEPKRLTKDAADEDSPSFSQDGEQIAYRSLEPIPGLPRLQRVWIIDLDTGKRRPLWRADDPTNAHQQGRPAWASR